MKHMKKIACSMVASLVLCLLLWKPATADTFTIDSNYKIEYSVSGNSLYLDFILTNGCTGYMSLSFHEYPYPSDTIVVWWEESLQNAIVWDAYNPGIPSISAFPSPMRDDDPIIKIQGNSKDNRLNVQLISASKTGSEIRISVERPMVTGDIFDYQLYDDRNFYVMGSYNCHNGYINQFNMTQPMPSYQKVEIWKL